MRVFIVSNKLTSYRGARKGTTNRSLAIKKVTLRTETQKAKDPMTDMHVAYCEKCVFITKN
jgi:hypothetical protein